MTNSDGADRMMTERERPRIVIVGGGFAGFHAARSLSRRLQDGAAEIVLVNPTDYFLYLPLLPEVAAGALDPRRVSVSLTAALPGARLVLGEVDAVDLDRSQVSWVDPEGRRGTVGYDRLVLAAGSVHKLLPIPGVADHATGFRGIPEALYLRDHIIRQLELAATADGAEERAARCTFVVVGAGYTGTEVAAQGVLFTEELARRQPLLRGRPIRWMLVDLAERVRAETVRAAGPGVEFRPSVARSPWPAAAMTGPVTSLVRTTARASARASGPRPYRLPWNGGRNPTNHSPG